MQPSFVLGFHGCDSSVAEGVFASGGKHLAPSKNLHDWLGNGIYFWEGSPLRAQQWAEFARDHPKSTKGTIKDPAVVGAIIDLGHCCSLHDTAVLTELRQAFDLLEVSKTAAGAVLPVNDGGADRPRRSLDCAVIEFMHQLRLQQGLPAYDSVRSAFDEGDWLYPGAGLKQRSHVQIAVRNPSRIKGYFRPLEISD